MSDECDLDEVDGLYMAMNSACDGYAASDVLYALGMMIAHAIRKSAVDKNPDTTMRLIRETVDLELSANTIGDL